MWDIPDSLRETVFFDDFEDNENEWPLEIEGTKLKIKKAFMRSITPTLRVALA